LDQPQ
jgi:hypothetical protein